MWSLLQWRFRSDVAEDEGCAAVLTWRLPALNVIRRRGHSGVAVARPIRLRTDARASETIAQ